MNNYTITSNAGVTYTRVSKATARRLYNQGYCLYVVPVKVNPDNFWGIGCIIDNAAVDPEKEFQKVVNSFTWYNCNYNELGKYPAFYTISDN